MKQFTDVSCKVTKPIIEDKVEKTLGNLTEKSKPKDKIERLDQSKLEKATKTLLTN